MFSSHLRILCRTCNIVLVRNVRGGRFHPPKANPGLSKRIAAFEKEGLAITDDDAEEFVEQSESDFYKVGQMYNEHLNETLMGKHELKNHIIREKYFKTNLPNLLTWSEKEQIRHLASTEPDEWTPEKIAQSFPVTVPVVKKLLKYAWKPATLQRIERHDHSAMRNWKELKEGSLKIPPKLREHFLKFSERTIPPLRKEAIKIDLTQETKMGEFECIVNRCAENEKKEKLSENNQYQETGNNYKAEGESKSKTIKDTNIMTLEELKEKINKRLETGKAVNMQDQIIANTVNGNRNTELKSNSELNEEIDLLHEDKETCLAKPEEKAEKDIMDYPERIRIPKKAYKKGATYKVNDCFYDHDGKFLYRVLGF